MFTCIFFYFPLRDYMYEMYMYINMYNALTENCMQCHRVYFPLWDYMYEMYMYTNMYNALTENLYAVS